MPYKIEKSDKGWFVVNKDTNKRKNKTPHASKEKAQAHMRALYAATANEGFDATIEQYLVEYSNMGATATGKFQPSTAGAPAPQQPAVNLDDPKHQELAYEMIKGPSDPEWSKLSPVQKKQHVDAFKKRMQQSQQAGAVASTTPPATHTSANPSNVAAI